MDNKWEEEFDNDFVSDMGCLFDVWDVEKIKQFITKTIQSERQRIKEKVIKIIKRS